MPGATAQANSGGYLRTITEMMRYAFPSKSTGYQLPRRLRPKPIAGGMQAMGRNWEAPVLLRIACAAQQALERHRPAIFCPIL